AFGEAWQSALQSSERKGSERRRCKHSRHRPAMPRRKKTRRCGVSSASTRLDGGGGRRDRPGGRRRTKKPRRGRPSPWRRTVRCYAICSYFTKGGGVSPLPSPTLPPIT